MPSMTTTVVPGVPKPVRFQVLLTGFGVAVTPFEVMVPWVAVDMMAVAAHLTLVLLVEVVVALTVTLSPADRGPMLPAVSTARAV